ncbi:hypothetical protein D9M69_466170 [compost metagenome]
MRQALLDPVAVEADLVQQRRSGAAQVVDGERLQRETFDLGALHDELRDPIQGRIGHAPIRIVARRKNEP